MKNILVFFFSTMPCFSQCPCIKSAVIGFDKELTRSHNNFVVAMDDVRITAGEAVALYAKKSSGQLLWYTKGKRVDEIAVKPYETTEYTVKSVLESCPDAYDRVLVTVEEVPTAKTLTVFPNPTSNELNVIAAGDFIREVSLYDINGRQLQQYTYQGLDQQHRIDLSSLNSGIYLLKVLFVEGDEVVKKIIKN